MRPNVSPLEQSQASAVRPEPRDGVRIGRSGTVYLSARNNVVVITKERSDRAATMIVGFLVGSVGTTWFANRCPRTVDLLDLIRVRWKWTMDFYWLTDFLEWWTPPRVSAGAAVVAACAAVIAAASGIRTLRQNRRDSKARNRPMVAAELREVPYVQGTQILVVRNYGPTIARNVRVSFDPEIPDPENPSASMTPFLKRRYATPVPVLTPGMELDNIYFSGEQQDGGWTNREPTSEQVTVTIKYENDTGEAFTDVFPLDTNLIRNRTYTKSSAAPEAQLKKLATAAKTLAKLAVETDHRRRDQEAAAQAVRQQDAPTSE
ncbi:MAG: hypothetical protein ACRCYU_09050 [Nocardioides sp.]